MKIRGQLPALVVDTPSVGFGTVALNATSPTISTPVRNQGPEPVTVSCAGGTASPAQFDSSQSCQGNTLNPGDTCDFSFSFIPNVPGELTGASNFICNGVALTVALHGAGPGTPVDAEGVVAVPTIGLFGLIGLSVLILLGAALKRGEL